MATKSGVRTPAEGSAEKRNHRPRTEEGSGLDGVAVLLDRDGVVLSWSAMATILTGRTAAGAVGKRFGALCVNGDIDATLDAAAVRPASVTLDLDCEDGQVESVRSEIFSNLDADGGLAGYGIAFRPPRGLDDSGVAFDARGQIDGPSVRRLGARNSAAFLVDASDDLRVLDASPAASLMLGRPSGELTGLRLAEILDTDLPSGGHHQADGATTPSFARVVDGNGAVRSCGVSLVPLLWNARQLALCVLHDVSGWVGLKTDLTRMNLELSRLARHDHLTDLFNRPMFLDTLALANSRLGRLGGLLGILYIDLDGFKPVNDRLGHDAGDRVLMEVGRRLKSGVRSSDVVARLGGDEFGAILENLKRREDALKVARHIIEVLSRPIEIDGERIEISASIGAVVVADAVADSAVLVSQADRMMYRAKSLGRGEAALAPASGDEKPRPRSIA